MKPKWCVSYKNEIDLFKNVLGFGMKTTFQDSQVSWLRCQNSLMFHIVRLFTYMQQGQDNAKQFMVLYNKSMPK